jgi:hypothetical protein
MPMLVTERVTAIDVTKEFDTICVQCPRECRPVSKVWDVGATPVLSQYRHAVRSLAASITNSGCCEQLSCR